MDVDAKEFVPLTPEAIIELLRDRQRSEMLPPRSREARRAPRWPFPGQVQIWIQDANGQEVQIFATCHNLSENGIGLSCECSLPIGARLTIAIHQPEATYQGEAVVRHCTLSSDGYFIGMEFAKTPSD